MTRAAVRQGDLCSGHDDYPPREAVGGSPNVFINGRPAIRVGDKWAVHCGHAGCHDSVQAQGSAKVFVNGLALARIGDQVACGSIAAEGSPDVFLA